MDGKAKETLWKGLFRSKSSASRKKPAKGRLQRRSDGNEDVDGGGDGVVGRGTRNEPPQAARPSRATTGSRKPTEFRPGQQASSKSRGKARDWGKSNGKAPQVSVPLTEWPPSGVPSRTELSLPQAQELISQGAPSLAGVKKPVTHSPSRYFHLYATTTTDGKSEDSDAVDGAGSMIQLMTMKMQGRGDAVAPWQTLEQPSYSFFYGRQPGTITLNQWVFMASSEPPSIALRDSGVFPRPMDLEHTLERLKELEDGLEEDDPALLYRILYKRMLRDPDKILSPHKTLDKQITDLILVLSGPDWIDFSDPKNQVATRFIFDTSEENHAQYEAFFHQLLLSLELDMRINSHQHSDWAKEKLLRQIPPSIQWSLALARRWRTYVRVEEHGKTPEDARFRFKLKKRQAKQLRRFAESMKWPNLADTMENLKQKDEEGRLDLVSSDAFAYFSGLVLPGSTFPFLIMNTLIDLDPDPATDDLALLSHMHPHCGFQYRNSYTYWTASCIVGRVLAPTCLSIAGWIGPARPTADLGRSQIARIRSRRPRQHMVLEDVESMAERSDALGPPAEVYPVEEYKLVLPDKDDSYDSVRIELLALASASTADSRRGGEGREGNSIPRLFDATVQFAIDGVSWPLRLMYDVSFISAWPCAGGPHPLFFDYIYKAVKVDDIIGIQDWGKQKRYGQSSSGSARSTPGAAPPPPQREDEHDEETVLVIEAFGVRDREVLARAWCSHWGLSAVVADVANTCVACAIREAYAATMTVVILIEAPPQYDEEDIRS